jgi:polar amino acid transport system substrate-binding protein
MSRTMQIVIVVLMALIVVALCVVAAVLILRPAPEPEPSATPAPTLTQEPTFTATAEPVSDDTWERIQAAGKIVVGTSADYPPFEFYKADAQIDGFDVALMDEIGRRLAIPVEYRDFAFEGLADALSLGQIDAAIAAVSVTPEREAVVDFSNVYFVGEDGVLAREDSGIDSVDSLDDLSALRVGAQRSTIYDEWLHTNLVDTGRLSADQVLVYEKAEDAIGDLTQDRVDLVMLDAQPALAFAAQGGVKVVGRGLNQQRLAIALPKGAASLKAQVDGVLTALYNEGFIADLAKQYLDLDPDHILPTPTPVPTPEATSTPAPPPPCLDGLAFVQHLNYDDKDMAAPPVLDPGQPFTKGWRVKNAGTCTWDSGYRLVYAGGNDPAAEMGGEPVSIQGQVEPGSTYDIQVDLVAPLKPGTYQAFWQMENGQDKGFGERLPIGIQVPAAPTPTPAPTQTPVPGITFTVDEDHIKAGECVEFYWKVDNVKAVYFYHEGEHWKHNGVTGEESRQECPPHTLAYSLRVVNLDDSVETRQITIYVEASPDAPIVERFTLDPPNTATLGQCVHIRWKVSGKVDRVTITANGASLWDGAPVKGTYQDCPSKTGNLAYGVEAKGPGGTSRGQQTIKVVSPATATPAPTPAPDLPVIHAFSAKPEQIPPGSCVSINWSTGGGTSQVTLLRDRHTVWDNAPLGGTAQDCLDRPGDYTYRLIASNPVGQEVEEDRPVTVREAAPTPTSAPPTPTPTSEPPPTPVPEPTSTPEPEPTPTPEPEPTPTSPVIGMPNPAAQFCADQGFEWEERTEKCASVGYCLFPDGSECEEWAYFRGDCAPGAPPRAVQSSTRQTAPGVCVRELTSSRVGDYLRADDRER